MFEIIIIFSILLIVFTVLFNISFKHCSEYEIFVVFEKKDKLRPQKIIPPKGFTFINPLFHEYAYISLLENMTFEIKDNIFDNNEFDESFECSVKICENPDDYNIIAENLAGLDRNEIAEFAKNIIINELRAISKDVTYTDFFNLNNYEKYFKQINSKLNKVGLELLDI